MSWQETPQHVQSHKRWTSHPAFLCKTIISSRRNGARAPQSNLVAENFMVSDCIGSACSSQTNSWLWQNHGHLCLRLLGHIRTECRLWTPVPGSLLYHSSSVSCRHFFYTAWITSLKRVPGQFHLKRIMWWKASRESIACMKTLVKRAQTCYKNTSRGAPMAQGQAGEARSRRISCRLRRVQPQTLKAQSTIQTQTLQATMIGENKIIESKFKLQNTTSTHVQPT